MKERSGFYDKEFSYLENFIGKKVVCLYWDFGKLRGYSGILDSVNPYDNIYIEGRKINFLGERTAIKYILYEDKLIIYSNHDVDEYTKKIGHFYHLIDLQNNILGYSVIDEHIKTLTKSLSNIDNSH